MPDTLARLGPRSKAAKSIRSYGVFQCHSLGSAEHGACAEADVGSVENKRTPQDHRRIAEVARRLNSKAHRTAESGPLAEPHDARTRAA